MKAKELKKKLATLRKTLEKKQMAHDGKPRHRKAPPHFLTAAGWIADALSELEVEIAMLKKSKPR
jgi:hypothetical protein